MLLNFFESLINPFKNHPDTTPPDKISKFYWHYLRQIKGVFCMLLIISFGVALFEVLLFSYLGRIVDLIQSSENIHTLLATHTHEILWMFIVIVIIRPLFSIVHDLLSNQALMTNFTSLIRWQHHRYVLKQGINFFHSDLAGGIANRIMNTGQSIRNSTFMMLDSMWRVTIYIGATLILFIKLDWRLALPLILWIAAYTAILAYFIPRTRERANIAARARSRLMGTLVDSYTNIVTLKLFSHADREEQYAQTAMQEQTRTALNSTRLITGMDFCLTLINSLLIAGITALALWLWGKMLISAGAIALAMSLVIRINTMSSWVMRVVIHIFEDIGNVQDGIKVIAQKRTVVDEAQARPLTLSEGVITFDNVGFSYQPEHPVYEQLNLAIKAKEKIGLIGTSGAGKSTLVNLLLRLYDLNSGTISIDGQNIRKVTQESLRANIGMVTQDTSLLHRSIRENLLYGKPDATDEELIHALTQTKAEFVFNLIDQKGNQGLDAMVGERGVKLSGGQRQRLAIARVLLKNAPILILDEATSALDSEIESVIQENLELLMKNKTVIAIAHRLSTIAKMDRLVVIDHGKIVETGTHQSLIEQNGTYMRLWSHQTQGFIL